MNQDDHDEIEARAIAIAKSMANEKIPSALFDQPSPSGREAMTGDIAAELRWARETIGLLRATRAELVTSLAFVPRDGIDADVLRRLDSAMAAAQIEPEPFAKEVSR